MHKLRLAAVAAMASCAVMLVGAGSASAAQTPEAVDFTKTVALTGTKGFEGTYTINRFASRGGKLVSIGTVRGTLRKNGKTRSVTRRNVTMPASLTGAGPSTGASATQLPPIPGACQVLNLVIGPIDLNLLGLRIRTNQINVRIDAVPGAGNLLGNLLCAITNLLNPGGGLGQLTGAIQQLAAVLNAILALIPANPATTAAAVAGR